MKEEEKIGKAIIFPTLAAFCNGHMHSRNMLEIPPTGIEEGSLDH